MGFEGRQPSFSRLFLTTYVKSLGWSQVAKQPERGRLREPTCSPLAVLHRPKDFPVSSRAQNRRRAICIIPTASRSDGLAGGGVKGGLAYGATDEFGFRAVENRVSVHDLHATLLHLLGFDHERLTYRYSGRDFRLTDVHGEVVQELLA